MNLAFRTIRALVVSMLVLLSLHLPAMASEGAAAPEPMVFTVNLGKESYLQFGLVFETASPESAHALAAFKPKIQHEIILLLSGKESGKLRTLEGKKELIEEIMEIANHAIHEDEKTGVKEVLFTKFLIQ